MTKVTKRTVDATEIRSSDYVLWDDALPGFGLRVFKSGTVRSVIERRLRTPHSGRSRIGRQLPKADIRLHLVERLVRGGNPTVRFRNQISVRCPSPDDERQS